MGFDTMRSFQLLSLHSVLRSPDLPDEEHLRRQDSFIADTKQRRTLSRERPTSDTRSSRTILHNSKPVSIDVPSFQATKAKWSPPPSPTSASPTASPTSPTRPSTARFDSTSSISSNPRKSAQEQNVLDGQLFSASCSGDLAGIEILLDQGASVDSCVSVGGLFEAFKPAKSGHLSPLAGAASYGQHKAAELLLARGAELNPKSSRSASSPLHQAIRSNDYELVQFLLERGADFDLDNAYKTTPIMYAVKYASPELISLLLTYKPDLNKVSFINIAAIHWSVWPGNASVTELLLKAGAHPNHPMNDGNTPLHCAVLTGSLSMVRCLLRYGADPLARNSNWESPLCLAEAQPEYEEILQLLKASIALRK